MEHTESTRQLKVAKELQKDMAEIIRSKGMAVFEGAMVTVSGVRISPDLSVAKVYVSIFPSEKAEKVMGILKENTKALRGELGNKVAKQLRIVPELTFFLDSSLDYVAHIEELLKNLFARKSHNVINIISAISAIGMAIGTAALIIILSIYNGFDSLVKSMLSNVEPDLLITPATGKTFVPQGDTYDWIYVQESVLNMCCVLEENVFINYDGHQGLAVAKGVDEIYEQESPVRNHLREGTFTLHRGDVPLACVGAGLAYEMGISPRFVAPIEIYYPSRTRNISLSNPAASLESVNVYPSGIFNINNEIDSKYIILPIEAMQELLEYEGDVVSGVEIRLAGGCPRSELKRLQKEISSRLGDDFRVSDRFQQNESLYRMMKYEKLSIYMILIFIIIIIAFNIFGSLSMLIIEKRGDIQTLRSMGAQDRLLKNVFVLEGWMISLLGLAAGLVLGIAFSLIQQHFGLIKMPGNFIVQAYPVILSWKDILATAAGVAIVGYLIALLPVASFYRKEKRQTYTDSGSL